MSLGLTFLILVQYDTAQNRCSIFGGLKKGGHMLTELSLSHFSRAHQACYKMVDPQELPELCNRK